MDGDSVNQGEALAAFVDQLGATLSVMINRSTSYSSTRRFVAQAMANDVGVQDSAGRMIVPYEFPTYQGKPTVASLCIVWDRPTSPTSGHRVFLRRALAGLGMDPSQVANVWAYPFALTSPPLENQCLTYLEATHEAIRASGAHYVVLLGTTAIHLWRRELQLNQVIGKIGVWKGTWFVYPMPNPIVPISDQLLMPQYRSTCGPSWILCSRTRAWMNWPISVSRKTARKMTPLIAGCSSMTLTDCHGVRPIGAKDSSDAWTTSVSSLPNSTRLYKMGCPSVTQPDHQADLPATGHLAAMGG